MWASVRKAGRAALDLLRPNDAAIRKIVSDIVVYSDGFVPASQFSATTSIDTLLVASEWSYACIDAASKQGASLGAQVQRFDPATGKWTRAVHPQLEAFLAYPSGAVELGAFPPRLPSPPQWTWHDLVYLWIAHLSITGDAYLVPSIGGTAGRPVILSALPVIPTDVDVDTDSDTGYPTEYTIGGTQKLRPDEIVHCMYPNPGSFSTGAAPLAAALRAVGIDSDAIERIKWFLANKVDPGLVVSMAGFMGITDEQRTAVKAWLSASYTEATASGRPLVVGEGTKVLAAPDQRHAIDYGEILEDVRQRVLTAFGTPPPVVGIYDNATLNNFETAFRIWWLLGLFPLLNLVYTTLNRQLIQPVYGADWRIWYDSAQSEISVQMLSAHADVAAKLVAMGYPPNLAASFVGIDIERVPELDAPLQNLAVAGREGT